LNFSRASGVQFWASRYVICLNRTSVWKVMTIWISQELSLFNVEPLDRLCARIGHPCEKLWLFEIPESFRRLILSVSIYYKPESDICVKSYDHFNFPRASVVHFRASLYVMRLNLTSVWKVMTIWISQEFPLFNFEPLDILYTQIGHPCETLWPVEFLESFRCLIMSVSIYYKPESDISLKSYDHLNFSRVSIVQFQASRHIMRPNRTSVWKVMTIRISREFPTFNYERINIL